MQKRKICVVTGSRAEYGLLFRTMKAIREKKELALQVIATGMHLAPEFGLTYKEIEKDGFKIDWKNEMLLASDTKTGITKSIGLGIIGFADAFANLNPDIILLLGDRFEILAAATAALIARIPVAHCHGGEITVGAYDESIRHSITKMAHLHFTSTEIYRNRVIQLGEDPKSVFNVGSLGIENINKLKLLSRNDFEAAIGFKLGKKNLLVTYHPETLGTNSSGESFKIILDVLSGLKDTHIIFTKPNADTDGRIIIKMIDEFAAMNKNYISFINLGQLRYLSALQFVDGVIGNSSSGILEVPFFKKGTVNIGDRQKGRLKPSSVIDCTIEKNAIAAAIKKLYDTTFIENLNNLKNPYANGNASEKITAVLAGCELKNLCTKVFHDK